MSHRTKKPLKRLGNKEFAEDIKNYIRYTHNFYETKVPEMKVLAKRLHEEYNLKDFYKVFNKFWNSGYHSEKALAIRTLNLFKEEFNIETWEFLKPRIKELRGWEEIDSVAANIIGFISLKVPEVRQELKDYINGNNLWLKRLGMISFVPIIKSGKIEPALKIVNDHLNDKEEPIQKACGILLREIGQQNPELLKKFIKNNIKMPKIIFHYATENRNDLRILREPNKTNSGISKLIFWR